MTIRHPFGILFFLEIKRWHKAKISCHRANIPRTPNNFTDSESPNKWLIGVPIRPAHTPLTPPAPPAKVFLYGGMTDLPFWSPWNKILKEWYKPLISCYLFLIMGLSWSVEVLLSTGPTPSSSLPNSRFPNFFHSSHWLKKSGLPLYWGCWLLVTSKPCLKWLIWH